MFGRYRAHLEAELVKQELLLKFVIHDKDKIIARLDEEVKWLRSRCAILEMTAIPALRPTIPGKKIEHRQVEPEGETNWAAYLRRHMEEEEKLAKEAKEKSNGVPIKVGADVHEPSSGSTVGQDDGHKPVAAAEVGQAARKN